MKIGEDIKNKETQMGPHRGALPLAPATGDKKFSGQKRTDFFRTFEIQKLFVGEDINIKRLKWDPIGEHYH